MNIAGLDRGNIAAPLFVALLNVNKNEPTLNGSIPDDDGGFDDQDVPEEQAPRVVPECTAADDHPAATT